MDLKDFVSETLTQIVEGIVDAQRRLEAVESNAAINPTLRSAESKRQHAEPSPVEFDVGVTVTSQNTDSTGEKIGAKAGLLSVVSLGASLDANSAKSEQLKNEAISRVRFSVQLAQPANVTTYRSPKLQNTHTGGY